MTSKPTTRRPRREIGTSALVEEVVAATGVRLRFRDAEVGALTIAGRPLADYLRDVGLGWIVALHDQLATLDLQPLVATYKPTGRPPFHPRRILGLIVYGMLQRQWSLRELEALARKDLGAILISGGLQPDHSALGEFMLRHTAALTEDVFVAVTRQLVTALHLAPVFAAEDGTIVEAATSRFRTLKAQAAEAARVAAVAAVVAAPDDAAAVAALDAATTVAATAAARTAARRAKDPTARDAPVAVGEPEAVVQPRKDGAVRPAYKPSLNVHPTRLIVGQHVDASSETAAVLPLLIQHVAVFDARPATALLDAGFHSLEVLGLFVALEIDVLCPPGKTADRAPADDAPETAATRFGKAAFRYDADADVYHCPAGNLLRPRGGVERDRHGQTVQRYQAHDCATCPQRARCTDGTTGRQVRRYAGDALKEGMREVLAQPAARRRYRQRQATVEPVIGALRDRQGLTRFHRRGLAKVRAEFGLHCVAHNLRQALRLQVRAVVACVRTRGGAWWLVVAIGV